jgi:hypothetical protein
VNFSNIGNSLITALTGTDPSTLQAELSAGEQQVTLAVEAIIMLLAVIVFQLFVVIHNQKG